MLSSDGLPTSATEVLSQLVEVVLGFSNLREVVEGFVVADWWWFGSWLGRQGTWEFDLGVKSCLPDLSMASSALDAAGSRHPWLAACGLPPPLNKVWLRALLVGPALISFHVFLASCLISHCHRLVGQYGSDLLNN